MYTQKKMNVEEFCVASGIFNYGMSSQIAI